jgi:hypothetical protein
MPKTVPSTDGVKGMSDTPRTDARAFRVRTGFSEKEEMVPAEFARQLERELNAMKRGGEKKESVPYGKFL